MPIYEYKCKKCGAHFEVIQKFNENNLKNCIHCGGPIIKLLSAPAIQFKGSGWYITDYAQKKIPEKEASKENKTTEKEPQDKEKSKKSEASSQN